MWQERIAAALLVVVGVANAVNGVVVTLAPGRAPATYGVTITDPGVVVLLRHRAVLLTLVGAGLVVAAFVSSLRAPAMWAAAISMASFMVFAFTMSGAGSANLKVAVTDVVLLALLGGAAVLLLSSA